LIAIDAAITLAAFMVGILLLFGFINLRYFLKRVQLLIPFTMLIAPAILLFLTSWCILTVENNHEGQSTLVQVDYLK
jgi:hypothetical protein